MEHPEINRVELLRGLSADERARFLIEWGLEGDPDPEVETLRRLTECGTGEYSRRIGPDEKPPRRTREQRQRKQRFERIYGKNRPRPPPEAEELPGTSHIERPQDGYVPNPFAFIAGRRNGATEGDSAHPAQMKPPEELPGTRHFEHPPKGHLPDDSPVGGDWITEGVHAHLERERARLEDKKALKGKPDRPYANDPFVSKEEAAANTGNPFTDVTPTRLAQLRLDEVARLYDAMAFARQAYGRRMNAHLTIRWSAIGVAEADAQDVLDKLLNRASKWVARTQAAPAWVWADKVLLPDKLLWVYVHEKARTYGFHTHVLLSFDVRLWEAFREWVFGCLARLVHREQVPSTTAVLRRSYAKSAEDQDGMHWFWFKYVIKQLDPEAVVQSPFCDKVVPAREIFEPRRLRISLPVTAMRLTGVCRRLDVQARTEAKYESRLPRGLQLYSDLDCKAASLAEDDRGSPYEVAHGLEGFYPNLNLVLMLPGDDGEVQDTSPHQYEAFETACDRLTEAKKLCQAAVSGKDKAAAARVLAEAQFAFDIATNVINLDRWGLMPDVVYYAGNERPKVRFRCAFSTWVEQLEQCNLKADEAYVWYRQYLQEGDIVDIVPREKMPAGRGRAERSKAPRRTKEA